MATDINSTNRVAHAKVREAVYGVTPANPAFKSLRVTSSTLNTNPQTVTSAEIRADRQVTDLNLVGTVAQGDIGMELSFGSGDDLFEESLQGAWVSNPSITVVTAGVEISALSTTTVTVSAGGAAFVAGAMVLLQGFPTAANNKRARVVSSTATTVVFAAATFTAESLAIPVGAYIRQVGFQGAAGDLVATANGLTSTILNFTQMGIAVGEWLKFGGTPAGDKFAITPLNNDFVRISAVAVNALTFDRLPAGWAADAGTGQTVAVFDGDYVRNGTNLISSTIERQYQQQPSYEYLSGMCIDKDSITVSAQKIVTRQISFIGRTGTIAATRFTGATDALPTNYQVVNASANVGRIAVNGSNIASGNFVMEATLNINNNLRPLEAVGTIGAIGIGNGEFTLTGTLNTYFADLTYYNLLLNNTATSFDFRVGRADGNKETLLFDLPRIKFSAGAPSVPGKNQNVMLPLSYQGLRDPVLGYTLQTTRWWYLE